MIRAAALLATLLTGACHAAPDGPAGDNSAGARLEAAAVSGGLVADPASRSIIGAWALDTDSACVVPAGDKEGRIGVLIDYGQEQGCVGSGSIRRTGTSLDVRLGECRITARFDGERIVFPPEVPVACDRLCTGRATLAAMIVERQSESVSEAMSLRAPGGRPLCGAD